MLISLAVVLIALVGLLLYVLASNPKVAEIGRLMFGCGLLAACFALGGKMLRLL
jgi:Na+/phosphate symporter